MPNKSFHVRIKDKTLEILKKHYPTINLPAQIAQAVHDLDVLKQAQAEQLKK